MKRDLLKRLRNHSTSRAAEKKQKQTGGSSGVKRRYSIRTALPMMILPAIFVAMVVLSLMGYVTAQDMLDRNTGAQMQQTMAVAVESIEESLSKNRMVAETMARSVETLHHYATPTGVAPANWEKLSYQDILTAYVGSNDETFGGGIWFEPYAYRPDIQYFSPYCMRMRTNRMPLYVDNYSLGEGVYYTDQEWYTSATNIEEASVWSAPYFDTFAEISMVTASAPMYDAAGRLMGVATADIDLTQIQTMIESMQVMAGGRTFLVDGSGLYIADIDQTKPMEVNITQDPNPTLAAFGTEMLQQTEGRGKFEVDGKPWHAWYRQIPSTGWYVVTTAAQSELRADVRELGYRLAGSCVLFAVALSFVLLLYLRRSIIRPMQELEQATGQIAGGDLSAEVNVHAKNELGVIGHTLELLVDRLRLYIDYINEIERVLNQMAEGDFTFTLQQEYVGEFAAVKTGLLNTRERVSDALRAIADSADQMSAGSRVVADSAQSQAQGATEQASSVEELSASIQEISAQVGHNAQDAQSANDKTAHAGEQLAKCDAQMQTLMQAMHDVSDKAADVSNIIKIIDNIAFQTNILALNAAVEAARAGAAGKGFSVVADEVRNLAAKSAEAAKQTEQLIGEAIEAVNRSGAITTQAAEGLHGAVASASEVASLNDRIAKSSQEQAEAIAQINLGLEQISSVVQNTAATAQESAATGEQLAAQSRMMQSLVERFHVTRDTDGRM